jgi:alpha-ketoglutarate-dependent taurine dioxygenase
LLFRKFNPLRVEELEQFIRILSGEPLEYRERSSPRHQVSGKIYTSTDYPANQPIFLHNENSYGHSWPLKIFFMCLTPPETGGETPLADCRKVFARLPAILREAFIERKICYVRNYGEGFGLPWQTVFQTEDKGTVEAYCQSVGLEFEWKKGNALRTRKVGRAAYRHPATGEWVWFNHATFFHISTLPAEIREPLLREFGEEGLSSNSYYGDGSPIESEVLEALRAAYRQETVKFKWHSGDVLLLDNMLTAHGRAAYSGSRKVVVAMSEPQMENEL